MSCALCSACGVFDGDLTLTLPSGLATLNVAPQTYPVGTEICIEEMSWQPDLAATTQDAALTPTVAIHVRTRQAPMKNLSLTFHRVDYQSCDPTGVKAFQGSDAFDPSTWIPVAQGNLLRDAGGRVVGARIMPSAGKMVVLAAL